MNNEMYKVVKNRKGFIAALDQSGGSSAKTLRNYGIQDNEYHSESEMFALIHGMRKRVMTSPVFTSEHILGTILFEKTMMNQVNGKFTADYLWDEKNIVSFLKIDKGLCDEVNQVKLMKEIPDLKQILQAAKEKHIFGTKMRSVIYGANEQGIKDIITQQFKVAKVICDCGLVPIIEPEVDINLQDKELCEMMMKQEIIKQLDNWDNNDKIMLKFTIPNQPNFYIDLYNYGSVIRIVALSGGYDIDVATSKLSTNKMMIASFSRALLQDLKNNQTDQEFNQALHEAIVKIYRASVD